MLKGMGTTIRRAFMHSPNERYPYRPKVLPERARSSFGMPLRDDGTPECKSCGLCEKNCPDHAITLVAHKREDGPGRVLDRFAIDLGLCMYCGLCVENCPSSGLHHTGHFETATAEKDGTLLVLYDAATAPAGHRAETEVTP